MRPGSVVSRKPGEGVSRERHLLSGDWQSKNIWVRRNTGDIDSIEPSGENVPVDAAAITESGTTIVPTSENGTTIESTPGNGTTIAPTTENGALKVSSKKNSPTTNMATTAVPNTLSVTLLVRSARYYYE